MIEEIPERAWVELKGRKRETQPASVWRQSGPQPSEMAQVPSEALNGKILANKTPESRAVQTEVLDSR